MYDKFSPNLVLSSYTPTYIPDLVFSSSTPTYIPDLCHRFPEKYETESLDCAFDQSQVLKEIFDHYTKEKPSVRIVSQLSPKDCVPSLAAKPINSMKKIIAYSKLIPSIVSVSAFYGVSRTIDCSGLIVEWDAIKKEAIILTSAKLLWSPIDDSRENHIIIRLADGTLLLGKEDYVDYYHNLLTLKVKSTTELNFVDLRSKEAVCEDLVDGMTVISLARMFPLCSLSDYAGELCLEYPYFGCQELLRSTCHVSAESEGGPLVNDSGYLVGMNFVDDYGFSHPLPIPIILASLDLWRSYRAVVRPWFGFSVVDVHQLPPHVWERFNVSPTDSYVVVKEVYEGSHAYERGVQPGDIVATCNGIAIHSAKQYSQLLFDRSCMVTSSGGSNMFCQSFKVVVQSADDCPTGEINVEAENLAVVDKRFCQCWPPLEKAEWASNKYGSQTNKKSDFDWRFGRFEKK